MAFKTTVNSVMDRPQVKFARGSNLHRELKHDVAVYFERTGLPQRCTARLLRKTAVFALWCLTAYYLLVFQTSSWQGGVIFSFILAPGLAGLAFNTAHDASHGAYSDWGALNRSMAWIFDLLGSSSYVWTWKHNILHHSFTNIAGLDDDIEIGPFGSLRPDVPLEGIRRLQHFYLWFLYAFLLLKWQLFDDIRDVVLGKIGRYPIQRPRGSALAAFIFGKVAFASWAILIPALYHPFWKVAMFYALNAALTGIIISVVFQLSHCVQQAEFYTVSSERVVLENDWARHQLATTVDFARGNRALAWYLGGLNLQVEHHLFPRVCHLHYPAISHIVERVCARHNVAYLQHKSVAEALLSHCRFMKRTARACPDAQHNANVA